MKTLLTIFIFTLSYQIFGQDVFKKLNIHKDSCTLLEELALSNAVPGAVHRNPLYIVNGVICRLDSLKIDSIKNIEIVKCKQAYKKYGYAGMNGVIEISTKENIEGLSLYTFRKNKPDLEKVIYAVNGYYLADTTIKIYSNAIQEVEYFNEYDLHCTCFKPTIVNIWIIKKEENVKPVALCRGLKIENW